jgi:hypothetical protein
MNCGMRIDDFGLQHPNSIRNHQSKIRNSQNGLIV